MSELQQNRPDLDAPADRLPSPSELPAPSWPAGGEQLDGDPITAHRDLLPAAESPDAARRVVRTGELASLRSPAGSVRRRWTLRARLIALVVGAAAIALAVVDVTLPIVLRSTLIADRDRTLVSVINSLPARLPNLDNLAEVGSDNPYLRGEIGWSLVNPFGVAKVVQPIAEDTDANPQVSSTPPTVVPQTVPDAARPDLDFRAFGVPVSLQGARGYLVAWSPMSDVSTTVRRLVLLELAATAGLLLLLGGVAGLLIRRGMKPLESMALAADEIAGGALDRRVTEVDPDTEVGRLALAFNGMLDGIGGLLAERSRGEERLRQFVADASHELRTPVAAVQGYTDLYRAGALPDEAAVNRAMQRMGFEAARMRALVEDLLTLIRADTPEQFTREPVDLAELLTGVVDDAAVIDPTRTWRLVGTAHPVTLSGDRMRLHQLFANLLSNIRTHTPPGSIATVSLLPGRNEVAVAVSDNGPGVSDEELVKIFDRFYRAEKSRSREKGGTGLGLAIVAAIAGAHGGRVMASHSAGSGLTITVVLPRASGTAAVSSQKPPVAILP